VSTSPEGSTRDFVFVFFVTNASEEPFFFFRRSSTHDRTDLLSVRHVFRFFSIVNPNPFRDTCISFVVRSEHLLQTYNVFERVQFECRTTAKNKRSFTRNRFVDDRFQISNSNTILTNDLSILKCNAIRFSTNKNLRLNNNFVFRIQFIVYKFKTYTTRDVCVRPFRLSWVFIVVLSRTLVIIIQHNIIKSHKNLGDKSRRFVCLFYRHWLLELNNDMIELCYQHFVCIFAK